MDRRRQISMKTWPMKTWLMVPLLGAVWVVAVLSGMWIMLVYEDTPGRAAQPAVQWPKGSTIPRESNHATLIMLAHPKCPCTRASIAELSSLMAHCQGKVTAYVLFYKPEGSPADWEKTDLWRSAAAIPGVHALRDEGGLEARRFRASTSGQTMLFDNIGRLLFSGGITGGRGHSGDNAGRSAIISLLTTGTAERHKTFVFGCSIIHPR
jgi:hypothetical protein